MAFRTFKKLLKKSPAPPYHPPGTHHAFSIVMPSQIQSNSDNFRKKLPTITQNQQSILLFLIVVSFHYSLYFYEGARGANLMDEGYLWQGVNSVKAGLIPIRDFHAYDPGRYYWIAAWTYIFGDGLVAMRQACIIFSILGVWMGVLVCRRIRNHFGFLAFTAIILSLWMEPRYKAFEQAISLATIYVITWMLEKPTSGRHFWAGVFGGAVAFFGRNHALYSCLAMMIVQATLLIRSWRPQIRNCATWSCGVISGFAPYALAIIVTPGFLAAYIGQLKRDIECGTNLVLPVPWPWTIASSESLVIWSHQMGMGISFLGVIVVVVIGALTLIRKLRVSELTGSILVLLASQATTVTYAHHAFSRADYVHLSHVGAAFTVALLACIASIAGKHKVKFLYSGLSLAAILVILSIGLTSVTGLNATFGNIHPIRMEVQGETLHVSHYQARMIAIGNHLAEQARRTSGRVAFIPHSPGLYATSGVICPLYQSYFIHPSSKADQIATIEQLKKNNVTIILLQDNMIDGRDDLRFRNTDPSVYEFIIENFDNVSLIGLPPSTLVYQKKTASPALTSKETK
jgi:hypothetical protein